MKKTIQHNGVTYKEGDIVKVNQCENNPKRIVYCERLRELALQNEDFDVVSKGFNDNVRGNQMLSTFSVSRLYEMEKIGFQKVPDNCRLCSNQSIKNKNYCPACQKDLDGIDMSQLKSMALQNKR